MLEIADYAYLQTISIVVALPTFQLQVCSHCHMDTAGLQLSGIGSLSTLFLMDLHSEFDAALESVTSGLRFDRTGALPVSILAGDVLGPLLSAQHLLRSDRLRNVSVNLAERCEWWYV